MKKGFTLIELLAVLVILAIILVIAVPKVISVIGNAKQSAIDSEAGLIAGKLKLERDVNAVDVTTLSLSDLDEYEIDSSKYDSFLAEEVNGKIVVTISRDDLIGTNGIQDGEPVAAIYGVRFENSSTGTRTDDAVGMTYSDPEASNIITSDFDTAEIYSEMTEETDSYGNVFIKIPKFYIKKQKLAAQTWTYQISKVKVDDDYYLPACFVDEASNTILPYILVGKYNASVDNESATYPKLQSKTGTVPLVEQTISYFRTAARANGAGYQLLDIHTWDAIQTLFYVEFATLDSQSIMEGNTGPTNAVKLNNGTADSIPKTGSPTSNTSCNYAMKYRGIENLYGNIFQFVDGINIQNNVAYVSKDASTYASDIFSGAYKRIGYTNKNADGRVTEMGYDVNHPYVNLPTSITESETSIYNDYYWQYEDNTIALVGGSWYYGSDAGVSFWELDYYSSDTGRSVGARLLKTPL
ncbi:MAG: type II secretion system protein [Bacilli bacterium]|nr:type II secretion system protein [Bacilli bacterium]